MRLLLIPGICFSALLATGALAQPAPPPGDPRPPVPDAGAPLPPPPPHGGSRHEGPPPPSKGAHFRLEVGHNKIDVKCADDEPMRACADITMQLLDRVMRDGPRPGPGGMPPHPAPAGAPPLAPSGGPTPR